MKTEQETTRTIEAMNPEPLEEFIIFAAKTCNLEGLESDVRELQIMMHQKTGGQPQYAKGGDICVETNYGRVRMCILGNAVAMVRDGTIDRLLADVPPIEIKDKTGLKDRDRRIAEENERLWGAKIEPEVLKNLVHDLERSKNAREREYIKRNIILEAYTIVLSGRLPK